MFLTNKSLFPVARRGETIVSTKYRHFLFRFHRFFMIFLVILHGGLIRLQFSKTKKVAAVRKKSLTKIEKKNAKVRRPD